MTETNNNKDVFLLVDSNALVHRAYHAFPPSLTISSTGQQVNAVFGFTKLLLEVLEKFRPKYAVCAFDSSKPTLRHAEYVGYKAHRKPLDSELVSQFPHAYKVVEAFNIPLYKIDGFEADDIIGTLASKIGDDIQKIIVTGDADLLQLVDESTFSYMAGFAFKNSKLYNIDEVKNRYGFGPEYVTDFKAIKGDPSDNIPGVKGIGDKGATSLIQQFGHLDKIYENIENIEGRNKQKLIDSHQDAYMSKKLATIMRDVPLSFNIKDAVLKDYNPSDVRVLFQELEFRTLLNKLPDSQQKHEEPRLGSSQFSMFIGNDDVKKDVEKPKTQPNSNYKLIKDIKDFDSLIEKIKLTKIFSFDTETDSLEIMTANIYGISIGISDDDAFYITKSLLDNTHVKEELNKIFLDESITKIAHNSKFDMHILRNWGIENIKGELHDTMLQAHLLQEGEGRNGLKELAFNKLGMVMTTFEDLFAGSGKSKFDITKVSEDDLGIYACADAHATWLLHKMFINDFKKESNAKMFSLYSNVEIPVMRILFEMERDGIYVNSKFLSDFSKELSTQILKIQADVHEIIGHEFNLNSPKQLGDILFGELGLPGGKKTKTGGFSTNERVLIDLLEIHPIVPKILEFRELVKLKSTYTDALILKVNQDTKRVHTSFNQAVASTGRLSSTDPNLQNIPISTENGLKIREAFESEKGKLLMGLDIAQQELRVVSILSGEDKLIDAFNKNIDVHSLTASQLFNIEIEAVTKEQRRVGKTMNFSLLYGISAFGLSDRIKMTREESQSLIDRFWRTYPKIKYYFDHLIIDARDNGFVETYFGRRRNAALLTSTNFRLRSAAERELMNFPIQGTSAELMKMSMIKVDEYIKSNNLVLKPKIILQVHDELVLEIDNASNEAIRNLAQDLKKEMESAVKFDVPLIVDVKIGKNWAQMETLNNLD